MKETSKNTCLGTDEMPAESLYVSIRGETRMGNIMVGVCYRLPNREKVGEDPLDNWRLCSCRVL